MNNAKRRSRRMATTYPVSTSSAWNANWARDTVETSTAAKEASEKTYKDCKLECWIYDRTR